MVPVVCKGSSHTWLDRLIQHDGQALIKLIQHVGCKTKVSQAREQATCAGGRPSCPGGCSRGWSTGLHPLLAKIHN
jgi:hypothetical protein